MEEALFGGQGVCMIRGLGALLVDRAGTAALHITYFRERAAHQRQDARAAGGMAYQCHPIGIASEGANVLLWMGMCGVRGERGSARTEAVDQDNSLLCKNRTCRRAC